jgi:hypothetical protein
MTTFIDALINDNFFRNSTNNLEKIEKNQFEIFSKNIE